MADFKLTDEQVAIISSEGNMRINAVAGSSKTFTCIEYAKARPTKSFLYLVFNRAAKEDALRRFVKSGVRNVTIHTAHSLAYSYVVPRFNYKVSQKGYTAFEIVDMFPDIQLIPDSLILASHVKKFAEYFCGSMAQKVQDLDYKETLVTEVSKAFVETHYELLELTVRQLLAKMDNGSIEISHDFYLKKFHKMGVKLPYDYILFDEGQDASGVMLDIFLKQDHLSRIIVGDTHQQIYGWRFAVNSLDKVDFQSFNLSKSFRFGENIANFANTILEWKSLYGETPDVRLEGLGKSVESKEKAIIARTNLGLLMEAINYISKSKKHKIYFEGNIYSYTYAEDGTSLYDILNLYNNKPHSVKDKMLSRLRTFDKLKEHADATSDGQLASMIRIVEEYGNSLPGLIQSLKDKHVSSKDEADMIFSTVHKSKGAEYDQVTLASDFLTVMDIKDNRKDLSDNKMIEAINLFYVAITRAKNKLFISDDLLPYSYKPNANVVIL
jgi:superfamily I DNA/RNA helicase